MNIELAAGLLVWGMIGVAFALWRAGFFSDHDAGM